MFVIRIILDQQTLIRLNPIVHLLNCPVRIKLENKMPLSYPDCVSLVAIQGGSIPGRSIHT